MFLGRGLALGGGDRGLFLRGGRTSALPLIIDFSTLPDGALPSPLLGATWLVASGVAKNTPTLSAEKLSNPGFESWTTSTNAANWTESVAGTSTINQETSVIHGGANAARMDIDASNSVCELSQAPASQSLGDILITSGWAKSSVAAKSFEVRNNNQSLEGRTITPGTSYVEFVHTSALISLSSTTRLISVAGTSASLYFDDISTKVPTRSTLMATFDSGNNNAIIKADWTSRMGALTGIVRNLDSASNPQNFVLAVMNASGSIILFKWVAGTPTRVATLAAAYVAGATLEVRKSGNTFSVYYNGAQAGTDQTISDAGIVNNTIHGLFSTDPTSQCDFFSAAAA